MGSALDVSPFNAGTFTQKYVNGVNQNFPSKGDNFIAQETVQSQGLYNNASMRFTARNARFLYNEMENLPNLENCSGECSNPYFIAGPDVVCAAGSYTMPGLQRGVSITWSVSPPDLATLTASGNSATLTRIGLANGIANLTANIGSGCTAPQAITKQVAIGTAVTGYYIINSNSHQPFQQQLFNNNSPIWLPANRSFGVTTVINGINLISASWVRANNSFPFQWSSNGAQPWFSGSSGSTAFNQRNGIFSLTAQNICGTVTQNYTWPIIVQSGSFRVAASPNPVGNQLNISFTNDEETAAKTSQQEMKPMRSVASAGKTVVTLFELNTGLQVRQWLQNETKSKGYNYSVAGLRKGVYVLQVDRDNVTATTKIIVE